jgi:D-3-phosphoglycerate dehydrogenase
MASIKKDFICVTTDYVEPNLDWEVDRYKSIGIAYRLNQLRSADSESLITAAADAQVLVVDQARINSEVIKGLPECRLIIRHGDGYDNLDLNAATENGIICANEPGFWSREVAEQTLAMALSLALKLPIQESVARRGTDAGWMYEEAMPYRSLGSRTIGVVGCGKIGAHSVRLFGPLVDRVLVYDPVVDPAFIKKIGGQPVTIDELVKKSDIVCIHTPANPHTIGLFDAGLIGTMKDGAVLINASRGSVVVTKALVEALISGRLSGAGLDATDPEPLPEGHPLFSIPNVIVTPHMGWYSEDALWILRKQIVEDVVRCRDGELPTSVVNPEVLEKDNLRIR